MIMPTSPTGPPVYPNSARNPFQMWVVFACTVAGVLGMLPLGGERTGVVDRVLPAYASYWYGGLLASGLVCLASLLTRPLTSLLVERIGLLMLGGWLTGFGGAAIIIAPRTPGGIVLAGLGVACVGRVWQIHTELKLLRIVFAQKAQENEERGE